MIKRFRGYLKESSIDPKRDTYSVDIFDDADTENPRLKPEVLAYLLAGIAKFDEISPVRDSVLIGSILTKRYLDNADLDLNILMPEATLEQHEEAVELLRSINGQPYPGTQHPVNYYAIVDQEQFDRANLMTDGALDIKSNKIIKRPVDHEFNIELYFQQFVSKVEQIDKIRSAIGVTMVDYETLKSFDVTAKNKLRQHVQKLLDKHKITIAEIISVYEDVVEARRSIFKQNPSNKDLLKYVSAN